MNCVLFFNCPERKWDDTFDMVIVCRDGVTMPGSTAHGARSAAATELRRSRCCDGAAQTSSVALILRVASATELMLLRRAATESLLRWSCADQLRRAHSARRVSKRRAEQRSWFNVQPGTSGFNHWEWLNTCYRYRCSTMVEHHTVQPLFNHCSTVQPLCSTHNQ